jgi:thioredoxin reductase (NADPH)
LIDQLDSIDNIEVHGFREIKKVSGENGRVKELVVENLETKETYEVPADAVFIFIGARPYTDWLDKGNILRDRRGFIVTGTETLQDESVRRTWKQKRNPFLLETCQPGIFAAGDVRSGAMNRVASAVGEGAMAVKYVHEYLATV